MSADGSDGQIRKMTDEEKKYWNLMLLRAVNSKWGQPALAYAFFNLRPHAVETKDEHFYASIDKHFNCYVNMPKLMEIGIVDASGIIAHEPWHTLRRHQERFALLDQREDGYRSHDVWNLAAYATINTPLGKIGEQMGNGRLGIIPENGVFLDSRNEWKGQSEGAATEVLYSLLLDNMDFCRDCGKSVPLGDPAGSKSKQSKDKQKQKDQQNGNQQGDQNGSGSDSDESSDGDQDGQDGQGNQDGQDGQDGSQSGGKGGSGSQQGNGGGHSHGSSSHTCDTCGQDQNSGSGRGMTVTVECGSGAGNKKRSWELDESDSSNISDEEVEGIRKQVANDIKKQHASNPGSVPGNMLVWADQELQPVPIDYRKLLRGQIRASVSAWRAGKVDYNRKRPSRRQVVPDVVYPKLMAPTPRIGVGIDVSGSMMWAMGVVVDQVTQIAKQCGVRGRDLLAFPVDTRVSGDIKPINDPKKVLENVKGGGGTDMGVGIAQLHELYAKNLTDIQILITDLQTDWPKQRPSDNAKYIIVGVVNGDNSYENTWVEQAREKIGDWAQIIIADVSHDGQRK